MSELIHIFLFTITTTFSPPAAQDEYECDPTTVSKEKNHSFNFLLKKIMKHSIFQILKLIMR